MSQINFGLLQNGQNAFYNALAMGQQAGQAAAGFFEARDERKRRNALADVLTGSQQGAPMGGPADSVFDNGPNGTPGYGQQGGDDPMRRLAELDPDTFMRVQAQQQAQAQGQQERAQTDTGTFRRLLQHAGQSPEGWQQAMGAAQSMGLDLSRVPQQYDPQWAQSQLFIMDALSDPATATAVVNDVRAMGLDPESPEGMAAIQELTLYKYAKQTTDEQGRPSLALPNVTMPGGPQPPAQEQAPQWGSGATFTFDQFRANVAAMGAAGALANMERNGIAVQIADNAQFEALPSGATFRAPDGTIRRKP